MGIAVLAIASMTLGLLISATVNSSDKTMPLLVVAVLAQVVLSGGVFRLNDQAGLDQLSWLSPSCWGFGAVASTTDLNHVTPPRPATRPTHCGSTARTSGCGPHLVAPAPVKPRPPPRFPG